MRFRLRVDPRDASDEFAVIGGTAPRSTRVTPATPAGVPLVWDDPWPGIARRRLRRTRPPSRTRAPTATGPRRSSRAPRRRGSRHAAASGELALAGLVAADALRIAAWRPRWAAEVDERTLPHELDWLRTAVHLSKGCYRGQETVAKVHNLGHPPRRLVALQLDGSDTVLPAPGAAVLVGEDAVGVVTSAALHFEEGPIALARRAPHDAVDAALIVDTDDGDLAPRRRSSSRRRRGDRDRPAPAAPVAPPTAQ